MIYSPQNLSVVMLSLVIESLTLRVMQQRDIKIRSLRAYLGFCICRSLTLMLIYVFRGYEGYFFAYWTAAILSFGFQCAIFFDLFRFRKLPFILFCCATVVILMNARPDYLQAIQLCERVIYTMRGIVLALVLLRGIKGHLRSVAIGMGVWYASELTLTLLASRFHLGQIQTAAFLVCLSSWLFQFSRAECSQRERFRVLIRKHMEGAI